MRYAVILAWQEVWWAIREAVITTAAAIFGRRTHGGHMVSFGRSRWFPKNYDPHWDQDDRT